MRQPPDSELAGSSKATAAELGDAREQGARYVLAAHAAPGFTVEVRPPNPACLVRPVSNVFAQEIGCRSRHAVCHPRGGALRSARQPGGFHKKATAAMTQPIDTHERLEGVDAHLQSGRDLAGRMALPSRGQKPQGRGLLRAARQRSRRSVPTSLDPFSPNSWVQRGALAVITPICCSRENTGDDRFDSLI